MPWGAVAALFIGGTTDWKLGPEAAKLCGVAKCWGKLVHVGRVNSLSRIVYALAVKADTIDGTGFTWYSDKRIPLAVRWIDRAVRRRQGVLWAAR